MVCEKQFKHFAIRKDLFRSAASRGEQRALHIQVEMIGLHKCLLDLLSEGLQPIFQNGQLRINGLPF